MRDGESADQILCTATVLVEEAEAIRGHQIRTMDLKAIYRELNELDSVALCLSGGGIRSAAFSLGVVQALASTPCVAAPIGDSAKAPGSSAPPRKLLERFHYLSTVSGGGYLGSWLSTWLSRDDDHAMAHLTGRPNGPDEEPGELSWLRAYSNYLTPKLGLTSADAWADVALYLRNLVLNWIVFLPLLMVAALLLKLLLIASAAVGASETATYVAVAAGALGIVTATAATMRNRPTSGRNSLRQGAYLRVVLLPSLAAAALFSAAAGSGLARRTMGSLDRPSTIGWLAAAAALIYAIGWLVGRTGKGAADAASWVLAGAFYGAFAAFGAFAFLHLQHADVLHLGIHDAAAAALLLTILGPPWILLGQITGEMIFVGLTSHEENSDADREWLGRSAGWVTAAGCIWLVVTGLVLVGSDLALKSYGAAYGAVGGLSGALTAVIGLSKYTPAVGPAKTRAGISLNALLAIVATLFAAILVISCSALLDQLLLGHPLLQSRLLGGDVPDMPSAPQDLVWLLIGLVGALAVGYLASRTVNINRFSLHALYRNRLIRAFLGASNPTREQDANQFARFALSDNPPMTSLWPPKPPDGWAKLDRGRWRPFHVINMALNIVSTRRLAWQERKAESFTISPLHAGSACKAYRRTEHYGDPNGGLSVGTAVAISGAAVSPNMGYHSSPAIGFLMALLNVRLGWWLGNPGQEGAATFRMEGPGFAIWPLLSETFGLTTDAKPYVYLSDGGHFENLGLYEMVRRRCRFILVVDAGCDKDFAFEDLGNAVRKVSLDLGVEIAFEGIDKLRRRSDDGTDVGPDQPYTALGTIDYPAADRAGKKGVIVYLKPAYHGIESASIRSYAMANGDFPHQSTANQWFSESQFESYRKLGFEVTLGAAQEISKQLATL
jgi:hypothetical protein